MPSLSSLRHRRLNHTALVSGALSVFVLASCNRAAPEPAPAPAPPSVTIEPTTKTINVGPGANVELPVAQPEPENGVYRKPAVEVPPGPAPAQLQTTDIITGSGKTADWGSKVKVHYVGVTFASHTEFDSSWNRSEPLEFELGMGRVIKGWEDGIKGMKEGGRRRLVIPPDLAYGNHPPPGGKIGVNETLVFVVDLVKVL